MLDSLTRWGLPLMTEQRPDDAVRSHWLAHAIGQLLADRRPDAPAVTVALTGDQPIVIEAQDGAVHSRLGQADDADVTLTGPPRPILGLLFGLLELADARSSGVTFEGDSAILDRSAQRCNSEADPRAAAMLSGDLHRRALGKMPGHRGDRAVVDPDAAVRCRGAERVDQARASASMDRNAARSAAEVEQDIGERREGQRPRAKKPVGVWLAIDLVDRGEPVRSGG